MSSSLPALPVVLSDQFFLTQWKSRIRRLGTWKSAGRWQPRAEDALCGPGGCENIIPTKESLELSIRNRISEELTRSELGAMERDARLALFYQDQQNRIAVHEHHRQARGAVNQAVRESSENYKVVMMQKFPGIQPF